MQIRKVGVVGAGLMGSGIAQVVAEADYEVIWVDISGEQLEKGLANIRRLLARRVEKRNNDGGPGGRGIRQDKRS